MKFKSIYLKAFTLLAVLVLIVGCNSSDDGGNKDDGEASGSAYPEREIEVYVPASAGGSTDATARLATEYLKDIFGQNFVIVNQTGGGGATAAATVDAADADGHTLLYYHQAIDAGHAMNQIEQSTGDFTALGVTGDANRVLAVLPGSGWENLDDFVAEAKENPGELKVGVDLGATTHMVGGMLADAADIDLDFIDVGDDADLTAALLGEQVDMIVVGVDSVTQTDEILSLAVVGNDRDDRLPEIPTAYEQGYDVIFPLTFAFFAPKDTPDEIVQAWEEALEELQGNSEYVEKYADFGVARFLTSEETAAEFEKSSKDIANVIDTLGLAE